VLIFSCGEGWDVKIFFGNAKIKKKCKRASGRLKRRLDDLLDADNMEVAMTLPGRCHALKENRSGQFAIDLDHPMRLIFEPANDPLPRTKDGHWELKKITVIRLLEVEDYHAKNK
jgi:plasmid maintenance system killer protein